MKHIIFVSHGDVELHPIKELPEGLKEVGKDKYVLALGETTGHRHVITATKPETMKIFQDAQGQTYIELKEEAKLDHEEHGVLTVKPGWYIQVQERERDWFTNVVRKVVD